MEKSKVYYTSMKVNSGTNLLKKLDHLVREAGIANIDFENKYTAIKIHFGEPGNLAFLRPNYAKVIVDLVKELGGKPFLTDCNTLYVGRRKNALDHLDAAYENGFSPFSTGCHVIIADGLKGTDETLVPVNGEYIKEAKIGHAVMDADIIISLNQFKGHESTGFGGAFKNLGMGCGSRAGKMEMHSSGKPVVNQSLCISCGECRKNCAHDAISFVDYNGENKPGSRAERKNAKKRAIIDHNKCVGCGRCIGACPEDAVKAGQDEANTVLNYKIAEYTYAVIHGRPNFHISLVIDVSPFCDCHAENDLPILPDVGMFASFDPVALDQACADACLRQQPIPGSRLDENMHAPDFHDHHDHFCNNFPETDWKTCLEHAERIGLGSRSYELIRVK